MDAICKVGLRKRMSSHRNVLRTEGNIGFGNLLKFNFVRNNKTLTSMGWACRNYIRVTTLKRILMFSVFVDFTSGLLSLGFHFTFSENCGQKQTFNKEATTKPVRKSQSSHGWLLPVCILTLCNLDVNCSFTENTSVVAARRNKRKIVTL